MICRSPYRCIVYREVTIKMNKKSRSGLWPLCGALPAIDTARSPRERKKKQKKMGPPLMPATAVEAKRMHAHRNGPTAIIIVSARRISFYQWTLILLYLPCWFFSFFFHFVREVYFIVAAAAAGFEWMRGGGTIVWWSNFLDTIHEAKLGWRTDFYYVSTIYLMFYFVRARFPSIRLCYPTLYSLLHCMNRTLFIRALQYQWTYQLWTLSSFQSGEEILVSFICVSENLENLFIF